MMMTTMMMVMAVAMMMMMMMEFEKCCTRTDYDYPSRQHSTRLSLSAPDGRSLLIASAAE